MTWALLQGWIPGLSNNAVAMAAGFLVQSTIIITVGLALAYILRKRGAAAQSAVLRAFLAAVFLCLPITFLLQRAGVRGVTFEIPLAASLTAVRSHSEAPASHFDKKPVLAPQERTSPNPVQSVPVRSAHRSASVTSGNTPTGASRPQAFEENRSIRPAPVSPAAHRDSHVSLWHTFQAMLAMLFTLFWAGCSLFLLGRLLLFHFYILAIRHSSVEAKPSALDACRSAAFTLGVRSIPVLQNPSVQSPFLAGILRPCIFLPLGGVETVLEERSVFLHELAHLVRHDTAWNLARHIGVALFPFQPLLWILSRRIEEMSDYACDDYVTHVTGMHRSYADSLIAIARKSHPALSEATAGVGIISFKSPMRRRVERILDLSRTITLRVGSRLLVLISSFCLCITFLSGLIGFRGKSYGQGGRMAEAFSRGGKIAAFTLLPLVQKQLAATIKPSVKPDDTAKDVPREETVQTDESLIITAENGGEPVPDPAVSEENLPLLTTASALSDDNTVLKPPAGAERDAIPSFAASVAGNSPAAKIVEKQTGSLTAVSFLPSILTGSGEGASNTGISNVKTGQLYINAKEQENSGLKSNLDWGKQSPVWSPDGKTIAFTEYTGFGIWLAPAGGGDPELLYNNRGEWEYQGIKFGGGNMRTLCFTPNGKYITVVNYIFDRTLGSRVDFSGAEVVVLGAVPVIEIVSVATGRKNIIAMNIVDGCWTPDSAVFIGVTEPKEGNTLGKIVKIDLASETALTLAETGASPCITPDGQTVIYTDGSSLFKIPVSGGNPERLPVEGNIWCPRCSLDGVWILGTGNTNSDKSHTWLRAFNRETGKTHDVLFSKSLNIEMGAWSPSGKQFCYTQSGIEGDDGATSIWIADFNKESFGTQTSTEESVPSQFKLIGNYPNPFNPSTTIAFSLSSAGKASLAVYNMTGQKVRELLTEQLSAGKHDVVWNGRDDKGKPVSSGVYIARLKMEGKVESHRMTLVK